MHTLTATRGAGAALESADAADDSCVLRFRLADMEI